MLDYSLLNLIRAKIGVVKSNKKILNGMGDNIDELESE
tara:strand:- start:490 stop:603 length:114 start_codon:yes stop_codon:yes gene_type:complete